MLIASDVSFAYDARCVVDRASVRVAPRTLLGVLGPNGAGKTTLLRLLGATLRPASGRLTLDDVPLADLPRARIARQVAVVPQETHLAFDYSVLEIALMGRYPHLGPFQLEGPADLAVAREALVATGTWDLASRMFTTLSGGEKQRVIIAAALAQLGDDVGGTGREDRQTRVLLLDEPTGSLDLGYQIEMADLLRQLNAERDIAVVVSTHDLQFAARLCRELILLREGRIVAAGPTHEVLTGENVAAVYGVEAEIRYDPSLGLTTVLPIARRRGRTA